MEKRTYRLRRRAEQQEQTRRRIVEAVKRGFTKDLDVRIGAELRNCFGVEPQKTAQGFRITFGALKRLDVSVTPEGKSVIIDTESDLTAQDDVIIDTNKRFRKYLDVITGFSTKERVERAKSVPE